MLACKPAGCPARHMFLRIYKLISAHDTLQLKGLSKQEALPRIPTKRERRRRPCWWYRERRVNGGVLQRREPAPAAV